MPPRVQYRAQFVARVIAPFVPHMPDVYVQLLDVYKRQIICRRVGCRAGTPSFFILSTSAAACSAVIYFAAMEHVRHIRMASEDDLPRIMELIECGRRKMRAMGNTGQWTGGEPRVEVVMGDIEDGNSYLVTEDGIAVATFALSLIHI